MSTPTTGVHKTPDHPTELKPLSLQSIVKAGLSLSARAEREDILLKLSGNGDTETPGTLAIYLRRVHAEALRVRAQSVIVDCDNLYFMSAACIKCLATWIDAIVHLNAAERYKVTFSPNSHLPWQHRAFEDLRRSAPSVVRIVDSVSRASAPYAAAPPVSGTLRQSQVLPHLGTVPQAGVPHSATMPQAKGSPSETMPQAKGAPSGTMPKTGTVPQTPAARRRR